MITPFRGSACPLQSRIPTSSNPVSEHPPLPIRRPPRIPLSRSSPSRSSLPLVGTHRQQQHLPRPCSLPQPAGDAAGEVVGRIMPSAVGVETREVGAQEENSDPHHQLSTVRPCLTYACGETYTLDIVHEDINGRHRSL